MPYKYVIELYGLGGSINLGLVNRRIYEYFKEHNIDLNVFDSDEDNELNIPEDMQPFSPSCSGDCHDIASAIGVELSDNSFIEVSDENGKVIWKHNLDIIQDDDDKAPCNSLPQTALLKYIDFTINHERGQIAVCKRFFLKGIFSIGEFHTDSEFDPRKLTIYYDEIEEWPLCSNISYDGADIFTVSGDLDDIEEKIEFIGDL